MVIKKKSFDCLHKYTPAEIGLSTMLETSVRTIYLQLLRGLLAMLGTFF